MRKDYSSPAAEALEISPGLALLNASDEKGKFENLFDNYYWDDLGTE